MNLSFRARINLALGVGAALVLAFGVGSYVAIESFLADGEAERTSQEAMLLLEKTGSQLRTAESWQRKFIITKHPDDLAAYQAAAAKVLFAIDRARQAPALRDDRAQVDELDAAIRARLANMEISVRARQEAGFEAASALVGSGANRSLRETIDGLIERIRASETAAMQAERAQTLRGAEASKRLIVAGGMLALVLLGLSTYLFNLFALHRRGAEWRLAETIAKLERASSALRASETQLREVLDTVPVMFGLVDQSQRFLFHNQAYADSIGRTSAQIQGRTLREVLGPTVYESVRPHIEQAFAGYTVTYERSQRRIDGALRDYEIKYFPRYGDGEGADAGRVIGVYAMGSDITEFKRIDRMKSEFVSTVSHELRTPLTSIRGSLGLISGGVVGKLPDKAAQLVEIARDNCERLVRLVDDILDIEKLEAGQMPVDLQVHELRPLLARVVAANEGFAAQHRVRLSLQAPNEPLAARVDADRFVQVATNLVSNGVRFSPQDAEVSVRLHRDGQSVLIEVADRGPGVPPEFRNRIFQKFSQADASSSRKKSGTGLGLSISKAFVERMGGRVGYRRDADETVFFMEFPEAASAHDAAIAGESAPAS